MSDRDYYELLGLTPRADGAMVDQAYWHLARKYQTLAATNLRARIMLDELNEAYGVLGTPRLREQYDAFRDDVLIQKGMITPVASKPKRQPAAAQTAGSVRRSWSLPVGLPRVRGNHLRPLAVGGIMLSLALAAAWQGVNPAVAVAALTAGLALALTPVLRRQLSNLNITLPAVSMPALRAPRIELPGLADINVPRLRELSAAGAADDAIGSDELRASTAAMISRWRNSVGLRPMADDDDDAREPSNELVEIVAAERDIERGGEPLAAVMDILRGSRTEKAVRSD
ncbi:MAG: DnaJ domain-containing protein [Chloroflexi bacterium]|nr:DnaJ domain-containing protein [Chloroflexota bacterium]